MREIDSLLRGYSTKDSIAALYYAVRYLRQANRVPKDWDEMFADAVESVPSKEARTLTKKLLASLESKAGKPAAELNREAVLESLDELYAASERLDWDITPADEAAAERWIARLNTQQNQSMLHLDESVLNLQPEVSASLAGYSRSS